MLNKDEVRIKHIFLACEEISSFVEGKIRSDLDTNRMLLLSLVKELEIIGSCGQIKRRHKK